MNKYYPSWPITYEEYLVTTKAHNFYPEEQDQWERRQVKHYGPFNAKVTREKLNYTPREIE